MCSGKLLELGCVVARVCILLGRLPASCAAWAPISCCCYFTPSSQHLCLLINTRSRRLCLLASWQKVGHQAHPAHRPGLPAPSCGGLALPEGPQEQHSRQPARHCGNQRRQRSRCQHIRRQRGSSGPGSAAARGGSSISGGGGRRGCGACGSAGGCVPWPCCLLRISEGAVCGACCCPVQHVMLHCMLNAPQLLLCMHHLASATYTTPCRCG